MRTAKKTFSHRSLQDAKSIRTLLEAVTSGIAKGKLTFSDEDDKIVMKPEGLLELKVSATQDEDRNRFNIRVTWQTEEDREKRKKSLSVK